MGTCSNWNMHENNQIYEIFLTKTKIKVNLVPNPNHDIKKNKNTTCVKQKSNKILLL
jgi:hypothetical protein